MNRTESSTIMMIAFAVSILIFTAKLFAWFITGSDAIFSDAMESIANVLASSFGLYGVYYSKKPKDDSHPYGHGKIEYLAAGFEGALILFAAVTIVIKATYSLYYSNPIDEIDYGIWIIGICGLINLLTGMWMLKQAKMQRSAIIKADAWHLITDAITSAGIIVGLIIVYFSSVYYIDSIIALILGLITLVTGIRLLMQALDKLMDRADVGELEKLTKSLNMVRTDEMINIHNLRIQHYGNAIHVDAHLVLPYYYTVEQANQCIGQLTTNLHREFHHDLELFIHIDPCVPIKECKNCSLINCTQRQDPHISKIDWTMGSVIADRL